MSKYNKEEILQAGVEILAKKGLSGLGVQNVLKACGIPKGSFYNFFDSKDAFIIEAIQLYNEKVQYLLEQIDGNDALAPIEKIKMFYSSANDYFYNDGNLRTCPMMNTISDHVENVQIVELIHSKMDMHKDFIRKWIESGKAENSVTSTMDTRKLTHMIYDNYHGVVLRMKYENSEEPLRSFINDVLPLYLF